MFIYIFSQIYRLKPKLLKLKNQEKTPFLHNVAFPDISLTGKRGMGIWQENNSDERIHNLKILLCCPKSPSSLQCVCEGLASSLVFKFQAARVTNHPKCREQESTRQTRTWWPPCSKDQLPSHSKNTEQSGKAAAQASEPQLFNEQVSPTEAFFMGQLAIFRALSCAERTPEEYHQGDTKDFYDPGLWGAKLTVLPSLGDFSMTLDATHPHVALPITKRTLWLQSHTPENKNTVTAPTLPFSAPTLGCVLISFLSCNGSPGRHLIL